MKKNEKNGISGSSGRNHNARSSSSGTVRKRATLHVRGNNNGVELGDRSIDDRRDHDDQHYNDRYLLDIEHVIFLVAIADE